jgi:hypothetical protein
MEVWIQVHKQVNAIRIYDTIQKKVKRDLFLFSFFSSVDAGIWTADPYYKQQAH